MGIKNDPLIASMVAIYLLIIEEKEEENEGALETKKQTAKQSNKAKK